MDGQNVALVVMALIGSGGLGALLTTIFNHRRGIKGDEREARRDTIADRESLIENLVEEVGTLRSRQDRLERELHAEMEWNLALLQHIYAGSPPPPPARPGRHQSDAPSE